MAAWDHCYQIYLRAVDSGPCRHREGTAESLGGRLAAIKAGLLDRHGHPTQPCPVQTQIQGFVATRFSTSTCSKRTSALTRTRFNEWSGACWEMHKDHLFSGDHKKGLDVRFLGIYHDDDPWMDSCRDTVMGRVVSQWWDKCDLAGPKSRPAEKLLGSKAMFCSQACYELEAHIFQTNRYCLLQVFRGVAGPGCHLGGGWKNEDI